MIKFKEKALEITSGIEPHQMLIALKKACRETALPINENTLISHININELTNEKEKNIAHAIDICVEQALLTQLETRFIQTPAPLLTPEHDVKASYSIAPAKIV